MMRLSSKKPVLYLFLLLGGLCAILIVNVLSAPKAAANIYPNNSEFNTNHYAVSSSVEGSPWGLGGGGRYNCAPSVYPPSTTGIHQDAGACDTGLASPTTRYKIFKDAGGFIAGTELRIVDGCKGVDPATPHDKDPTVSDGRARGPDKGFRRISVEVRQTQPGGAIAGGAPASSVTNYSGACNHGGNDLIVPVPGNAFTSNQWRRYGYNFLTASVIITKEGANANNPGQKFFKLQYGDGTVVGDEDGLFALGDGNESGRSSYGFHFKAHCNPGNGGMTLRIRDIDVNQNNGGQYPQIFLINADTNGEIVKIDRNSHGGAYRGQTNFDFHIGASHVNEGTRYTLIINNMAANNGFNIGLPFSEFGGYKVGVPNDDCYDPPDEPGLDPAIPDCNTYRHNMGSNSRYRFTVFARDGSYMNGGPPNREDTVTGADNRTWRGFDYSNPNYVTATELTSGDTDEQGSFSFDSLDGGAGPKGPDWIVYVERWHKTGTNEDGVGIYQYGLLDDPIRVMNCYSAVCESMSIVSGTIPGRPTGVESGQNFRIGMTFRNTGRDDLPASMRGHNLSATDGDWSFVHGLNTGIPEGGTHYFEITLGAPSGRTTKNLSVYPDYYNLFALANHAPEGVREAIRCGVTISTYERFQLVPHVNSVSPNDLEDPTRVRSNTSIDQIKDAPYTSTGIPATSTRSLTLKRGGATIANLIGPVNDSRHFSNPDPYPYSDEYNNASIPRDFQAADQICANISISADEGWIGPGDDVVDRDGQPRHAGEQCNRVVDRPFVRMYGGDVFAGGMFGQPGAGTSGDIKTYIKRATNVPEGSAFGAGSGVEFAAFALGVIERTADQSEGFTSATLRSSAPSPATGLSFATSISPGTGFGGNFASVHMATDYFNSTKRIETSIQNRSTPLNVNTELTDGQQSGFKPPSGTKLRLNGGTNYDKHHSLYIEGDVFISNNITYAGTGGWATLSAIPSFELYVKGNIYISAGVTQLDGLYVAQPNGSMGGKIYTCSAPADGSLYGSTQIFGACRTQLKVNGAFIAQEMRLLRTAFTLSDVPVLSYTPGSPLQYVKETFHNDHAAESFRLTPEMFLTRPVQQPKGSQSNGKFDQYLSLPPVL